MKASKMIYQNLFRIRLDFGYDPVLAAKIKTIPDSRWCSSQKTWHIPYTREAFELLKAIVPDVEYTRTSTSDSEQTLQVLRIDQ